MEINIPELKEISKKLSLILKYLEPKEIVVNKEPVSKYFNVKSLAEYLNISPITIYKWTCSRTIPYFKVGRRALFKMDEIEQWIMKKRLKPIGD